MHHGHGVAAPAEDVGTGVEQIQEVVEVGIELDPVLHAEQTARTRHLLAEAQVEVVEPVVAAAVALDRAAGKPARTVQPLCVVDQAGDRRWIGPTSPNSRCVQYRGCQVGIVRPRRDVEERVVVARRGVVEHGTAAEGEAVGPPLARDEDDARRGLIVADELLLEVQAQSEVVPRLVL